MILCISVDASGLLSLIKLKVCNSGMNVKIMGDIGSNRGISIIRSDIAVKLGDGGQVKLVINVIIYIFRRRVRQTNISRIES